MKIERSLLRKIIEGALLAADGPMNLVKLAKLFELPEGNDADVDDLYEKPTTDEILNVVEEIQADCEGRGYELKQVASGWRFQVVQEVAPWINRLWEEKPQRYSRALLETLALIAYRQPITRGDIESIRGVAVSSTIIKTLTEREWVKVVGHRDVPGRPALYATTRQFLDYFNLKSLDELPSLKEIQDFDKLDAELDLAAVAGVSADAAAEPEIDADASQLFDAAAALEANVDVDLDVDQPSPTDAEVEEGHELELSAELEAAEELSDEPLVLDEPFGELHQEPGASETTDADFDASESNENENPEDTTVLEQEER